MNRIVNRGSRRVLGVARVGLLVLAGAGCSNPTTESSPDLVIATRDLLSTPDLIAPPDLAPPANPADLIMLDMTLLPTLTGASPSLGATTGGNAIHLTGSHFAIGMSVAFGAVSTNLIPAVANDGLSATVTLPPNPGVQGRVPLTVTLASGASATRGDLFSYYTVIPGFAASRGYAVGDTPMGLASADFNLDGKTDLVVANSATGGGGNGGISVLLGNGDGTFQAAANTTLGVDPEQVAVGDLTGDGKPDVVVVNSGSSTISVLAGKGDGTFLAPITTGANVTPYSASLGDLNGDGKLDLVSVAVSSGEVNVLLGKGDGGFQSPQSFALEPNSTALGAVLGDVNGDKKLDILVANLGDSAVNVLLGKGDGTFQAMQKYSVPNCYPRSIDTGDLDGDGDLDVVVDNSNGNGVYVLLGKGDGSFGAAQQYAAGSLTEGVRIVDLNGDAKPDIAAANGGANNVSVLMGKGDGTFQTTLGYPAGKSPYGLLAVDLNGDQRPDLVTTNQTDDAIGVILNMFQ